MMIVDRNREKILKYDMKIQLPSEITRKNLGQVGAKDKKNQKNTPQGEMKNAKISMAPI